MRALAILSLTVLVASVSGCASDLPKPPPEPDAPELSRVQLVQEGMKPAEVRELLGKPELVETPADRPGSEIWHYQEGLVLFQNDAVVFRHARPAQ